MNFLIDLPDTRKMARRVAVTAAFICSLAAYLLTIEPDASYWDCPEYLVTAANLEIGHPPGNPVWTLMARIVALFGGSSAHGIAVAVNVSSAIFMALATALLASVIFIILSRVNLPIQGHQPRANWLRALCAWSGAMCFGWNDSPWFSAVEAEVYAMSMFLTALTVRLMLGWMMMPSGTRSRRYLLLIVYLTGLSIGVHQLNLLVIPALALMWLFRRRRGKIGFARISLALILGAAAVGLILLGMMPGVIYAAAKFELYCVNELHWPMHSGVWLFWTVALLTLYLLPGCIPSRYPRLELLAWIPALLLTGFASYMLILVRGAANPPMNEGAPSNIFALQSYLARDQYGSTPLFYGRTPYSKVMRLETFKEDGSPDYSRNALEDVEPHYAMTDSGYVVYEHSRRPVYTPELNMFLPRLTSTDPADIKAYADWAGMTQESMQEVEVSFALDSLGKPVGRLLEDGSRVKDKELRPTYLQQLQYLLAYQIGYMYCRYLMWNFSGRQNDRFSTGEVEHGNFITGFAPIDNLMLGDQSKMPDEIGHNNPGHNVYYMIPLLLAILGMVALQHCGRRGRRLNLIIAILFLMTGVAIVIYLNQSPGEPRERDYSFLGSFWTFCIWIAAGLALFLSKATQKSRMARLLTIFGSILSFMLPAWILYQNYDDHDRSRRTAVTDYATNLLESLEPNAILFTNGDNFTFPLWWAQEVAGIRRDVTIVNLAYLTTPWYINQLRGDGIESDGLKMQMPVDKLLLGNYKFTAIEARPSNPSLRDSLLAPDAIAALRSFYSSAGESPKLPAILRLPDPEHGDSIYIYTSDMASGSRHLGLKQLAMLDIILSNSAYQIAGSYRPVYWQSASRGADYGAFKTLTARVLHSRRLVYRDSLGDPASDRLAARLLDTDWRKAMASRSGRQSSRGKDRPVYADDTYGYMLTSQRQALLRFGGRLLKAGQPARALRLAHLIDSVYPASIREYHIYAESDSLIDEGIDLARLYMEGSADPNSKDYQRGLEILRRERLRYQQWHEFRQALPPRLRGVLSPKNLRKTQRVAFVDSLINQYSK